MCNAQAYSKSWVLTGAACHVFLLTSISLSHIPHFLSIFDGLDILLLSDYTRGGGQERVWGKGEEGARNSNLVGHWYMYVA